MTTKKNKSKKSNNSPFNTFLKMCGLNTNILMGGRKPRVNQNNKTKKIGGISSYNMTTFNNMIIRTLRQLHIINIKSISDTGSGFFVGEKDRERIHPHIHIYPDGAGFPEGNQHKITFTGSNYRKVEDRKIAEKIMKDWIPAIVAAPELKESYTKLFTKMIDIIDSTVLTQIETSKKAEIDAMYATAKLELTEFIGRISDETFAKVNSLITNNTSKKLICLGTKYTLIKSSDSKEKIQKFIAHISRLKFILTEMIDAMTPFPDFTEESLTDESLANRLSTTFNWLLPEKQSGGSPINIINILILKKAGKAQVFKILCLYEYCKNKYKFTTKINTDDFIFNIISSVFKNGSYATLYKLGAIEYSESNLVFAQLPTIHTAEHYNSPGVPSNDGADAKPTATTAESV